MRRDEKRIDELKTIQLNEKQKYMETIEDERMAVLAEKSKLETMARLKGPSAIEVSRIEIDAAVKVAQVGICSNLFKQSKHFKFRMLPDNQIQNENGF